MHRHWTLAAVLAGALAVAHSAHAQPTDEPAPAEPPAAEPAPAVDVSEADLETFADIYAVLLEAAGRFEEEVSAAETLEEVEQAQEKMRRDSVAAIEAHGWTLDTYNAVAQAINASPELTEEALRRIEERS